MKNRKAVFEIISEWSLKSPNKTAVEFNGDRLSYQQLETRSRLLADYLLSRYPNNKRGRIAVYLEPGVMMPVVLLAILKAGHTYVPLSHFHPSERIIQILDDSSAFLLISTRSMLNKTAIDKVFSSTLVLEDIHYPAESAATLPPVSENDLAYILYTSGSTGKPKGVAIEHRNLSYYLNWFNEDVWPETCATLPLTSTLSFAAAVTQLYAPLLRGDTLFILPADSLNEPEVLLRWHQQHPEGAIYCVPTVWDELLRYQKSSSHAWALPKTVFLSGEPVSFDLKERTFEQIPNVRLFNLYGPTETTANCSFAELKPGKSVTLGKALRGSEILIVDESLRPVSEGEEGEICAIGEGVARGYINRDELTQQRFFTHVSGDKRYWGHRTGDLGKRTPEGEIVYLGRLDRQIKINGIRIEPEEVEIVLRQHADIDTALVRPIQENGRQRLVAYLVSRNPSLATNDLRRFLQDKLPRAMHPAHFIMLETLPKLPNGKLDVSRLPAPCPQRPELGYPVKTAGNELEQELIDIWQEVLGFRELGANDNFFDLGGDSLQAMKARLLIRKRLFSEIDYPLFFNNATPHLLAFIVPYYVNDDEPTFDGGKTDTEECAPSSQQRYFLTLDQLSPEPSVYQLAFRLTIDGTLDESAVEWSIRRILEGNPVLRTRFDLDGILCLEGDYPTEAIQIERLTALPPGGFANTLSDRQLLELVNTPEMDIEHSPLICFHLVSLTTQRHILLVRVHHTVFDHDAIGLFFSQFVEYVRAYSAGDRSYKIGDGERHLRYRQQQLRIKDKCYPIERQFWLNKMEDYLTAGADATAFPLSASQDGENYWCILSDTLTQAIKHYAQQHRTTPFVCMLTAFTLLLKTTDYRHVPIGIPVSNRMLTDNATTIGCFVNMVTYYDDSPAQESFNTLLARSQNKVHAILDNQTLPYDVLMTDVRAKGWSDRLRFPVSFNYLTAMPPAVRLNDAEYRIADIANRQARLDLTLSVYDDEALTLCFNYQQAAFKAEDIAVLSHQYHQILMDMVQPNTVLLCSNL
ncbi:non-ribosomal peptide synthetase [Pectobacterium zantedeschiae]|uniref:Non-ribosomal peptide synthetase n=2 Tax=Pectobacterium zantedeschiae TaxID=2034769 RepID=A0A9X8P7A1_9GAMM|nr:non-ribosomal peptide synthetase [Pectobacterium zantedeschiae]RYC42666.1 non-ribosomal peptide synthetase [Pectobacterium zantedeschiae]RYC46285.1 non-ribosomal peptide synthetase [Pectobacterium zantedeschiae]